MNLEGSVYLVAGGPEAIPHIVKILNDAGIATRGNPDVYIRTYPQFGIHDAQELRDRAQTRPLGAGSRVFIIATPAMTAEAQNALLKTFEESPAGASFFVIVPSPDTLLSTLRSRVQMLVVASSPVAEKLDAGKFLSSAPSVRLEILKPLLEKGDDEKRELGPIISFLGNVEKTVANGIITGSTREGMSALYRARKYLGDKGALVKPLLEHVALLFPVVK
jgi:hypothetical protein